MVALRIMPKMQANPNSVTPSVLSQDRDMKIPAHDSHGSASDIYPALALRTKAPTR
jgi:hypothetical protein